MLLTSSVILNEEEYRLARQDSRDRLNLPISARAWQSEKVPKTVHRRPQSNIVRSDIPNEYIATFSDWSQGVVGDLDPDNGNVVFATGIDVYTPGSAKSLPMPSVLHDFADTHISPVVIKPVVFNDLIYFARNKGVYRIVNGAVNTVTANIGNYITDMCVFGDKLYVGYGDADYIDSIDAADTIVASTQVKARFFAVVEDRLWRSVDNNFVSQITAFDANPLLTASWGSLITVGTTDRNITSLCGYGERLAVSKEDGLYLGDSAVLFPNVLTQVAGLPYETNGSSTLVVGSALFYNHRYGIWRYEYGQATEVGLQTCITGADPTLGLVADGVSCLASGSGYLWAGTKATMFPLANPQYVFTATNGTTNITANITASTSQGITTENSVLYVSAPVNAAVGAQYRALWIETATPVNMSAAPQVYGTINITNTTWHTTQAENNENNYCMQSGAYVFFLKEAASGATITPDLVAVNGVSRTWVKLSFTGGGNPVIKRIAWIDTLQARASVYRGRPRGTQDSRSLPIIWEPVYSTIYPVPMRGIITLPDKPGLSLPGGGVLAISNRYVYLQPLAFDNTNHTMAQGTVATTQFFVTPYYDMGVPQISKQMLELTLAGRRLDSTHTITVSYRKDTDTSFTSLGVINTNPGTIDVSTIECKRIQFKFAYTATGDYPTELNSFSVRYRELHTSKNKYTFTLEIADNQQGYNGNMLPDMEKQLTNLEALVHTGDYSFIDPVSRSKTVTVEEARIMEYLQEKLDYPVCLVQLVVAEV